MNYRMQIQYDGARYRGWQRQAATGDTIQGKLEAILTRRFGRNIEIDGASRTDAGVHALAQIANFHVADDEAVEPEELQKYINQYLPEDIAVTGVVEAGERFHSRLNATGKTYEYHLIPYGTYDVFARKYAWQMTEPLDIEAMREAANNPGGVAGMGVGMGAGVSMGQMFAQSMNAAQQPQQPQQAVPAQQAGAFCTECGKPVTPGAKFCPNCGAKQSTEGACSACGAKLQPGAKFCPNCGAKQ